MDNRMDNRIDLTSITGGLPPDCKQYTRLSLTGKVLVSLVRETTTSPWEDTTCIRQTEQLLLEQRAEARKMAARMGRYQAEERRQAAQAAQAAAERGDETC